MSELRTALNTALPGNPRYQPEHLSPYFGYDYLYRGVGEVEVAGLQVLGEIGIIPAKELEVLTTELIEQILSIPTTEVDQREREVTHHDIRAWVQLAQGRIGSGVSRWVHIPYTSYDVLDTGRSLQYVRAYQEVFAPSIKELIEVLAGRVREFAGQIQIGRTHGQHALPITVGFWMATALSRILYNAHQMDVHAKGLVGKISGAVGAKNAQVGLGIEELCGDRSFELRVLDKLGLEPAPISTQILPPEPLAYFLYSCCMMSASLAQFANDCRHLMRTEIAEVAEEFVEGQVGSSVMAHKRNPINFETVVGQWLKTKNEFGKVLDTLISEHQRDLVASTVYRDFPTILVNLLTQFNTLLRKDQQRQLPFLSRITVDPEACQANFERSAHVILAEPLYIALQMAGYEGDAHELVNHALVPRAMEEGKLLIEVAEMLATEDTELADALSGIPSDVMQLLHHPERYTGNAEQQALQLAERAETMALCI